MDMKNRVLFQLSRNLLRRNERFKDIHKGESCYIIGNGISIKDMDLKRLGDKISIGCGYLFLHNEFDALNAKYYAEMEPFWFYRYWKSRVDGKWEINRNSEMQKQVLKQYPDLNFFTSLSNRFAISGNHVYYMHHFDAPTFNANTFDMAGVFYFRSLMYAMIGMAIYMGFEKAYLIGCDYTFSPQRVLHFYEKGHGKTQVNDTHLADFFRVAQEQIDLVTVTTNGGISKTLKYIDYRDLTGVDAVFRENTELVKKEYLDVLADYHDYLVY